MRGIVVPNVEDVDNNFVHIMGENDKLLHVWFRTKRGIADTLIYKEVPFSSFSDDVADDELVGEHSNPLFWEPSCVQLLPEAGGAMVVEERRQRVIYVEPTKEMRQVLICSVPPTLTYKYAYSDFGCWFFVTYDGYLFLYLADRVFRLWVDLDYRSDMLTVQSRCLTVWDRNFPAIGDFGLRNSPRGLEFQQGQEGRRFVTALGARGGIVGDLKTGKTFFSDSEQGVVVPVSKEGGLGFATMGKELSDKVYYEFPMTNYGEGFNVLFEKLRSQCHSEDKLRDTTGLQDEGNSFEDTSRDPLREYSCNCADLPSEDEDEYDAKPKLFKDKFREISSFKLNRTFINAPQVFQPVDHPDH
ncbi:hypothetical protein CJU89_6130 [Yarrowia sp. B02]|nr:hypothetical protein CJU89_6130 [Yarrowia sp. B02]